MVIESSASTLLLKALVLPPEEAERCWREWRASVDLDRLQGSALLTLSMLADRLPVWLADDPARGMLLGICKRCWSRNQLMLRDLALIARTLREAHIEPVVLAGSAAWTFVHQPALRPIESLELLIRRQKIADATAALKAAGWVPSRDVPTGNELDRLEGIWFDRGRDRLKLSWRLLPGTPEMAAACEKLPTLGSTQIGQETVALLAPEEMLLQALSGYRDASEVDWKCDALQLLKSRPVNWRRMRAQLHDSPQAMQRIRELQEHWGIAIPAGVFRSPTRWEAIRRDYEWHVWHDRRERSRVGFAAYLCERWWKVFVRSR